MAVDSGLSTIAVSSSGSSAGHVPIQVHHTHDLIAAGLTLGILHVLCGPDHLSALGMVYFCECSFMCLLDLNGRAPTRTVTNSHILLTALYRSSVA